jgi:hypothetical protein
VAGSMCLLTDRMPTPSVAFMALQVDLCGEVGQ